MYLRHYRNCITGLLILVQLIFCIQSVAFAAEEKESSPSIQVIPQAPEAYIPFANNGGVSNWRVVDDSTLLVQDIHGHWYVAKLQSAAYGLAFANSLGFTTAPSGRLEKFSSVVVDGRRYPIISFTRTILPKAIKAKNN